MPYIAGYRFSRRRREAGEGTHQEGAGRPDWKLHTTLDDLADAVALLAEGEVKQQLAKLAASPALRISPGSALFQRLRILQERRGAPRRATAHGLPWELIRKCRISAVSGASAACQARTAGAF